MYNIIGFILELLQSQSKMNLKTEFNFNDFSRDDLVLNSCGTVQTVQTVQTDSTLADIPILDEESVLVGSGANP